MRRYADGDDLNLSSFCRLKYLLNAECKPFAEFFHWCQKKFERADLVPRPFMKFFRCISSVSPVCSYFPNSAAFLHLMSKLKDGEDIRKDPQNLLQLQALAPVIFALLSNIQTMPPVELLNLFDHLKSFVIETFKKNPHPLLTPVPVESEKPFSFLPNWPVLNIRGLYKKDFECSRKPNVACNKDYRGHPTLMPGIFTLYCKHGE